MQFAKDDVCSYAGCDLTIKSCFGLRQEFCEDAEETEQVINKFTCVTFEKAKSWCKVVLNKDNSVAYTDCILHFDYYWSRMFGECLPDTSDPGSCVAPYYFTDTTGC